MSDRTDVPNIPKSNPKNLMRWRHILGRFAQNKLQCQIGAGDARIEAALNYLITPIQDTPLASKNNSVIAQEYSLTYNTFVPV